MSLDRTDCHSAIMIEDLQKTRAVDGSLVLHYFCRFDYRKQQTELAILRSLVCQLLRIGDYGIVEDVNRSRASHRSEPDPGELASILTQVCQRKRVFLIIDALDELETPMHAMKRVRELVEAGARVMLTSRPHPDITRAFSDATWIEVLADHQDIRTYIEQRFADSDFSDYVGKGHSIAELAAEKAGSM